jgi:glutamate racemase
MNDDRPIGVFDSGVGGLTVLAALQRRLPQESTLYLGDTARVPYGTRSAETVVRYAKNNVRTLVSVSDVKIVVVACNTVSAVALPALTQELRVPVVGVIDAGARAALAATRGGTIAVLGTAGTVRSGAYPRTLAALGHTGHVVTLACPLFVPLAEEGWTHGDIPERVAKKYLAQLPNDVDTVVLGCTHYPLLHDAIRSVLPAGTAIVDGGAATAEHVARVIAARTASMAAQHRLLVTDAPEQMVQLAPAFLGRPIARSDVDLVDVQMTA